MFFLKCTPDKIVSENQKEIVMVIRLRFMVLSLVGFLTVRLSIKSPFKSYSRALALMLLSASLFFNSAINIASTNAAALGIGFPFKATDSNCCRTW